MTTLNEYSIDATGESLAQIIQEHVARERNRLCAWRTWNYVAWLYLQGVRYFNVFDPSSGSVQYRMLDEDGNMQLQLTELLSETNKVEGQLGAMDVAPKVTRNDSSLQSIRDRSSAQVVLENVVSPNQVKAQQEVSNHIYTYLGSVGIRGGLLDHPTIGMTSDIEVVHPHELYPFPSLGEDLTKVRGMVRERMVDMASLKKKFGKRVSGKEAQQRMEWYSSVPGQPIETNQQTDLGNLRSNAGAAFGVLGKSKQLSDPAKGVELVRVLELWLNGPHGTCSRYVMVSGSYVLVDEDFSDREVFCPIGFGRFFEDGTFHGSGMFSLLFSLVRNAELMMQSLFRNSDTNQWTMLVVPRGTYNMRKLEKATGDPFKILEYEPEGMGGDFRPFAVEPVSQGDIPGKTAAFAREVVKDISPLTDLIEEKGRVDSAVGLQFLEEKIRDTMNKPIGGIQKAWGDMYRSLGVRSVHRLVQSPSPLPVGRLSMDLAGVVIDPKTKKVSFNRVPIQNASKLIYTIRLASPRSEVARKQEALALHQMLLPTGESTLEDLVLFGLDEGLDFAVNMNAWRGPYEVMIEKMLILYGDGETPGQITMTPHQAKPGLQVRMIENFMGSPQFNEARPEVQDAFAEFREALLSFAGLTLPQAVPNPDDAALLTEQERQLQEEAQSQGQGPFPLPGVA